MTNYGSRLAQTTTVKRMTALPDAGGRTLFFHLPRFGKSGVFLRPEEVPAFDGKEAEFEYEKIAGRVRLLRLVRVTKP